MNIYKGLLTLLCFFLLPEMANSFSRSWYQKAHVSGDARHRCTAFSIGNKGYYGGGHINSGLTVTYQDYWEFDPATNSWTQIADFGGGRRYHSSAFTIDNVAYVGAGENNTHHYTNDFWKYIPAVNTWFPIAELPAIERRGGTAFAINGVGYYGNGQSDDGYHTDFYSYDTATDTWTAIAEFPGEPRSAAVSFTHDGKAYVGTGHMVGAPLNDFYEYNPVTDSWLTKAPVGGSVRQDAIAFVIDGKGYIGTGDDSLENDLGDIWEYDFSTDIWTQIEDFEGVSRHYATTFTIDDIVYLIGGTNGTNLKDCWAYAPTVSIEETAFDWGEIALYPNPSTNKIQFSTTLKEDILNKSIIRIADLSGRVIFEMANPPQNFILNKTDFGSGLFLVQFYFENELYRTEKIQFN